MPGQSLPENSFTLDQAQAGSSIEVAMIGEDLEDSVELMRVLQNQQMMPGHKHTILESSEVMQSITLEKRKRSLGASDACGTKNHSHFFYPDRIL